MKKQLTLPFIRDGPAASIQLGVYSINSIYQLELEYRKGDDYMIEEKALLNENIFGIETYKEKILNFQNSVYGFVSFINARKYVIAFLAAVLSAIYAAFANQISINFILFHTFFYLYLSDSLTKIFEVIIKKPEFDYYKCLYQYYSRDY